MTARDLTSGAKTSSRAPHNAPEYAAQSELHSGDCLATVTLGLFLILAFIGILALRMLA